MLIKRKNFRTTTKKVAKSRLSLDPKLKELYLEKLRRLILTDFIERSYVHWHMQFFGVLKGCNDIRLLWDGTSSRMNKVVWAPSFFLPTRVSLQTHIQENTFLMDMFLNFPLHASIKLCCSVPLYSVFVIKHIYIVNCTNFTILRR